MRLHTALHVMSCVVVAPVTGGNIAEIGTIRVLRIRSEGKRNRRVEIALSDNPPT